MVKTNHLDRTELLTFVDHYWRSAANILSRAGMTGVPRLNAITLLHHLVEIGVLQSRVVGTTRQYRKVK